MPDRDLRYYLDLSSAQLRRFAADEPSVLVALLRMLRSVAIACRDDDQRREVLRSAQLVAGQMPKGTTDADRCTVDDMLGRVERALDGDIVDAFADRAGETRSI